MNVYSFFGFTVLTILTSPNVSEGKYVDACYSILLLKTLSIQERKHG